MNKFQAAEQDTLRPFRIDPELERGQIARLRAVRTSRSLADVQPALEQLEEAAVGAGNLMPHILNACRACATVGEISNTFRRVFGEYRQTF